MCLQEREKERERERKRERDREREREREKSIRKTKPTLNLPNPKRWQSGRTIPKTDLKRM